MRIIARRHLTRMATAHGDCIEQAADWYRITRKNTWHNLAEVRRAFRHADVVGDKTVFNIKGNDYPLVVHIDYEKGIVYIKALLTHAEYDRGKWKEQG